jgi:alkylation response protein AidB-like acyl-CoA dehydrogenase
MSNFADKKHIGFMRSLCMGNIEKQLIFPFPQMKEEEKQILKDIFSSIESWLKPYDQDFRKWDYQAQLPDEVLEQIKQLGLFGLIIPEEFGGLGLSSSAYSRVLQELAKYDASIALTVGAHSSIGMRGLVLFGTPEQKKKYLPDLATGKMVAAFCLTESGSGSDAASIRTKAVFDEKTAEYVLSGEKIWITNGGIASFLTVFAKTEGSEGQMSAFLVDTQKMPGVSFGPHEDKMGIRASHTTTVNFDQVRVPAENLLGEKGKGFKVAMKILNSGRTGLGGGCTGAMKKLISLTSHQASQRKQFGKNIAEFGLIKEKIGNMMVDCYAAESVVNLVAGLIDQGHEEYAVEAAISKVFATEALWRSVDEALQVAGGNGFMREYPYERMMRDSRINRIFEGTNDILRLFISLTAMSDVSAQLKELGKSMEGIFHEPIKGFGLLSEYGLKKISQLTGVSRTQGLLNDVHPSLSSSVEIFESAVRDLSSVLDKILIKYGKSILNQQFVIKRLADIMVDLFVQAAVMSRVNNSILEHGLAANTKELQIAEAFSLRVKNQLKERLYAMDHNNDEMIKALSDYAVEQQGYTWDTI